MVNARPQKMWQYGLLNLVLLALLIGWLWQNNQPVSLPDAILPADGKVECISYAPYYGKDQTPFKIGTLISKTQIDADLTLISQRSHCVRIYSVGQGLDYVPEAATKLGMKVLLGVWIGWISADNEKELKLGIKLANQYPETIKGLIVGNEVLLRGEQKEVALQQYITRAKQAVKVPVSYADVWEFWIKHKNLANSVDFITVHILPYWEDNPQSIEQAIPHANIIMNKLAATFQKPVLIGETGWPSIGRQREKSVPSQINQARYIRNFLREADTHHWQYNLIEALDQPWKRELEGTVGGFWGIYNTNLLPKFSFTGAVSERNDSLTPVYYALFGALTLVAICLLVGERRKFMLLNMLVLGAVAGTVSMLQLEYLNITCGDDKLITSLSCVPTAGMHLPGIVQFLEWLSFGGAVIIGWVILICIPITFSKHSDSASNILRFTTLLLLVGMITASMLLIIDGRYREFPIIIYLLPSIQLSLGLILAGISIRTTRSLSFKLGLITLILAVVCIALEFSNINAIYWLVINALLLTSCWCKEENI